MQVLLRDNRTSLYYAGQGSFTSDPVNAIDFRDAGLATQFALHHNLSSAEIVLNFVEPACQVTLPIRPDWTSTIYDPPLLQAV